jgi:sulfide dehydrogenase cytochrome subunit
MKYMKRLQGILIASSMAVGGAAFAATPSAEMLGNTCAGCHGTNGNSMGPATPTIAGAGSEYFIDSMMAYKSGERASTIMTRIAKGYTDDEIKAMAEFFAKQPIKRQKQMADSKMAGAGKKLHDKYCEKCHEDGGRAAEDGGLLAGQWKPYLKYTMDDFMNGSREMPKKMKRKVEKMHKKAGDAGIDQILEYYASQQ